MKLFVCVNNYRGHQLLKAYFVILSSMDLGSRMKVGRVTLLRSAPGRNCEMMWERTAG